MTKCPQCAKPLDHLNLQQVNANTTAAKFKAIVFSCPVCDVAIGVQIDPILLAQYLKTKKKT